MTTISIITTVFNGAATLDGCLQSIDSQTFKNLEHIVIDAASNDSTLAVLDSFSASHRRAWSEPDAGIYDGMNKGLRLVTGDIIGILNADDMYADEQVLQDVCDAFAEPGVDCCYGDLKYVDFSNTAKTVRLWKSGKYNPGKFRWGWMPPHPTFFVRRTLYEQYGGFNLQLGTAADYELMLRFLLKNKATARYIPRVLVKMRNCGASNATFSRRMEANRMDRKAWAVNGLKPLPWTIYFKPLRKLGQWVFKNW
jgi:glycosyltransferase involved in cell wall biosynthesis